MQHLKQFTRYFFLLLMLVHFGLMQSCSRQMSYQGGEFNYDDYSDQGSDPDGDGILSIDDNCPDVYNPDQLDSNGNGIGDACDTAQENLGEFNANAVLLRVEEMTSRCGRLITWQDHSSNETKFEVIRIYRELDYSVDNHPEWVDYQDILQTISVNDPSTAQELSFEDTNVQSWMEDLQYQIKTHFDDGSIQLSNIISTVDGC